MKLRQARIAERAHDQPDSTIAGCRILISNFILNFGGRQHGAIVAERFVLVPLYEPSRAFGNSFLSNYFASLQRTPTSTSGPGFRVISRSNND